MIYSFITIVVSFLTLGYALFISRRDFFANPVFYFTAFQIINFLGTIPLLDFNVDVDRIYFFVYVVSLLSMLFGFVLGDVFFPVERRAIIAWQKFPLEINVGIVYDKLIFALVLFSVMISVLYFIAVGYNVFLLGIINLFSGGGVVENVSDLRMASYNSDMTGNYYYPGYVNQFKDTLLPISLFYLWAKRRIIQRRKLFLKYVLTFLSLVSVVLILGTGQRGAFVLAMLQGGAFLMVVSNQKERRKIIIFGASFLMSFMILSTFMIGRTSSGVFNLGESLSAIWWRIASANQTGAVIGFREIIYKEPAQWGAEFWQSIVGLLPGVRGSMLSNRIAQKIWGGYGTAPPSNWGAIYYDFHWFGLVLIPAIFSIFIKYLYSRFYQKEKVLFRVLVYVAGFVILGTWIAGNLVNYYFNVGLFAIVLLRGLMLLFTALFGRKKLLINSF